MVNCSFLQYHPQRDVDLQIFVHRLRFTSVQAEDPHFMRLSGVHVSYFVDRQTCALLGILPFARARAPCSEATHHL